MTAMKSEIGPKEQAFLQHVYDKFKAEGRWPSVRQLQIELVDLGRIQTVADMIGGEYVRCDFPGDTSVCSLELRGVAVCEGAQGDIENFLATIRYAAQRYVKTEARPCISGAILQSALGMTQPEAQRACVLLQSAHGLWGMSSPVDDDVEIMVGDEIVHYQEVQSLDEFWARGEHLKQQIIQAGSQSVSRRVVQRKKSPPAQHPTVMFEHVEGIADDAIRALVERDARELQRALQAKMWKAAIVLAGGCAEAVLLDLFGRHPDLTTKHFPGGSLGNATLGTLVDKAHDASLITEAERDMASAIRHWRNLTHPALALRAPTPSAEMAHAAVALLNLLLKHVVGT
jgi:hypothetical protein